MSILEQLGLRAIRCFDPETAHSLALKALNLGLGPNAAPVTSARLKTSLAGLALANPVGVAAGFDKNAQAIGPILRSGPGFLEIGAVTPKPQPGNPRPRLFRLSEDRAAINRFGFNNDGMLAIRPRLQARRSGGVVGVNLGANKDAEDRAQDYVTVLECLYDAADFFTINVSSPNTEKLRDLQGREALSALLSRVLAARAGQSVPKPIFLKIAPDLDDSELADISELATTLALDGIIATNTTLARDGLASRHADEMGGLSGQPLFETSTAVLGKLYGLTQGRVPLIGVGGVGSAEQAYAKIKAGASAVQLYTAMVYEGLSLAARIAHGLDALLQRDGFASVEDAVGVDAPVPPAI